MAGAPLAGIHRGAFGEREREREREIPELATVYPHLVCHVDKYSPRRNLDLTRDRVRVSRHVRAEESV